MSDFTGYPSVMRAHKFGVSLELVAGEAMRYDPENGQATKVKVSYLEGTIFNNVYADEKLLTHRYKKYYWMGDSRAYWQWCDTYYRDLLQDMVALLFPGVEFHYDTSVNELSWVCLANSSTILKLVQPLLVGVVLAAGSKSVVELPAHDEATDRKILDVVGDNLELQTWLISQRNE